MIEKTSYEGQESLPIIFCKKILILMEGQPYFASELKPLIK